MKVNIEELANRPEHRMTLEFNEKIEELNSENTVKGVLTASLISGGVRLEGHVETDLVL